MQNNFEKQVQDKMDELRFNPSGPVWQNIEWQIRRKKDRRRILFWLPLLLLLAGGGTWWIWNQDSTARDAEKPLTARTSAAPVPVKKDAVDLPAQQKDPAARTTGTDAVPKSKAPVVASPVIARNENDSRETGAATPATGSRAADVKRGGEKAFSRLADKNKDKGDGSAPQDVSPAAASPSPVQTTLEPPAESSPSNPEKKPAPVNSQPLKELADSARYKIALEQQGDTASNAVGEIKTPKADGKSMWKWGAAASVGMSGVGKGFSFANEDVAYDNFANIPNAGTSGGFNSRNPSPVRKGLAFSLGLEASKTVSSRMEVTVGLQYQYYSTTIAVGQQRTQDTTVNGGIRMSSFFTNSGSNFRDFGNQYHFVSLPLQLQWQVARQVPLYLQGGLSLQYLVHSDAVIYDERARVYYQDKNAFHTFQLSGTAGLSYGVIRRSGASLYLGPQIQYGFTSLEKHETSNRLFTWGLGARLVFGRK